MGQGWASNRIAPQTGREYKILENMAWATGAEKERDPLTLERVTTVKDNKPEKEETPERKEQRHQEITRLMTKAQRDDPLVAVATAISELRSLPAIQNKINKLIKDAERENTTEGCRQAKTENRASVRLMKRGLSDDVEETIGRAVIETDSGDSNTLTNVALLMANFLRGRKEGATQTSINNKNRHNKYRNWTNQRPYATQTGRMANSNGTRNHKTQRRYRPFLSSHSRQFQHAYHGCHRQSQNTND